MQYLCPNPACFDPTKVVVAYYHLCNPPDGLGQAPSYHHVYQPPMDPFTGLPTPIPCPDGLASNGGPPRPPCGDMVEPKSAYCYTCGNTVVF